MERIPSLDELVGQATHTANSYLIEAISFIDENLGEGYAKKHPELIGAFIQAAAKDYDSAINYYYLSPGLENIASSITDTSHVWNKKKYIDLAWSSVNNCTPATLKSYSNFGLYGEETLSEPP